MMPWKRLDLGGQPHDHGYTALGEELRTAYVTHDNQGKTEVTGGLKNLKASRAGTPPCRLLSSAAASPCASSRRAAPPMSLRSPPRPAPCPAPPGPPPPFPVPLPSQPSPCCPSLPCSCVCRC